VTGADLSFLANRVAEKASIFAYFRRKLFFLHLSYACVRITGCDILSEILFHHKKLELAFE
jgi:hypothetical protein